MKPRILLYSMVAVCVAIFAFSPNHLSAQNATDAAAVNALLKDVQDQAATMADNQKQIDEKLAAVNESIRQARIYATRGGK